MATISIKLSDSLAKSLAQLARERGVSKSALIRQTLQAYVENGRQRKAPKGSFLEAARDLIGSVRSGIGDLSTNPKHMEGFGR